LAVYEEFGPHRVSQGCITGGQVDALFDDRAMAWAIYGDPPWGEGNTKFWNTKARKDTGDEVPLVTYDRLIERWFDLASRYVLEHAFVETGLRWEDDTRERMAAAGFKGIRAVRLQYRSGNKMLPNILLHGSRTGKVIGLSALHDLSGYAVPRTAIEMIASPGEIVFDPCCGLGYSAQAALDNGMVFRGNELNPVRLEKTKRRLA
jgi:hypothetical protein